MAATIATATGADNSRTKQTHRLGSRYSQGDAATWRTFATATVWADGHGDVTVKRDGITLHTFEFGPENAAEPEPEPEPEPRYNGWTNWSTWNTALWLDNEPGPYEQAGRIVRTSGPHDAATLLQRLALGRPSETRSTGPGLTARDHRPLPRGIADPPHRPTPSPSAVRSAGPSERPPARGTDP